MNKGMLKAHSLLYAIYICLIVGLICGAMLIIANLYSQLNLHYATYNELYIHNQSVVNFALKNVDRPSMVPEENDGDNAIKTFYEVKRYGILPLIIAKSYVGNDTVTSVHFAGLSKNDNTCLYIPVNGNMGISYSGNVNLTGRVCLPSTYIKGTFVSETSNKLNVGNIVLSAQTLPEPAIIVMNALLGNRGSRIELSELPKKDSLYYNSFKNPTLEVDVTNKTLSNINFKGNIVLYSSDSLKIDKSAHLEDVIIVSPKISFGDYFSGSVQAFANQYVHLGTNVHLHYPSVVAVYNSFSETEIKFKENSMIYGSIISYGNDFNGIRKNSIEISKGCKIFADVYCSGSLMTKSDITGSVFTNKIIYKTNSGLYENCMADVTFNAIDRPQYFMSLPLVANTGSYGLLKKLL